MKMYKIKSVEIINMHNYDHRIFKFDSDITYICGKNGKGKSTILQAIQLGLYGFIPGQSKLNKDIIKNSNSNYLKIILTLIEGNNTIEITRSWEKSGASVKSSVTTVPEDISIDFADSVLLPIIDFNSFCDLSTENQKKWFLQYLDIDTNNVDWSVVFDAIFESEENKDALKQSIQKQFFGNIPKKSTSVYDDVNAVHNFAKQAESLAKLQLTQCQSTIQELLINQVTTFSIENEDSINYKINQLQEDIYELHSIKQHIQVLNQIKAINLAANSIEQDTEYINLSKKLSELETDIKHSQNELDNIQIELEDCTIKHDSAVKELKEFKLKNLKYRSCPYTNEVCNQILEPATQDSLLKYEETIQSYDTRIKSLNNDKYDITQSINSLNLNKLQTQNSMNSIVKRYDNYNVLLNSLDSIDISNKINQYKKQYSIDDSELEKFVDNKIIEDNNAINDLNALKKKIIESNKDKALLDKCLREKYTYEMLEIPAWNLVKKYTSPSGMLSVMYKSKFNQFADTISEQLSSMYESDVKMYFNVFMSARSFDFGIIRNDNLIPYNQLSSGEKCMFTITFLTNILKNSKDTNFATINLDDLLDHVDTLNFYRVFNFLRSQNGVQYIIAGVRESDYIEDCSILI